MSNAARLAASLAAALAFWAPSAGAAPEALADVPILADFPQISVVADIGNHPGVHCILDTGSSIGILHSALTAGASRIGAANVHVANGTIAMPIFEVRKVAIGSADMSFVKFMQRDHSWFDPSVHLPCVIGSDFMNHFTVDFDGAAGRVRLYPGGTRIDEILGSAQPAGTHLDTRIIAGLIRVDTMVGSTKAYSEIDTGWNLATANWELLRALGFAADDARIHTVSKTQPDGKQKTWKLGEVDQVRIGNLHADKVKINVGDADMSHIAAQHGPYLHIGSELIRQHRLLIDYAHADVALVP